MTPDLDAIDALLAEQEKAVRDAFRKFIVAAGTGLALDRALEELRRGNVEAALAVLDSYIASMANVIPAIMATVGDFTAAELAAIVADAAPDIVSAISFDPSFPRAAEIARNQRMEFIRDFTAEQRKATQQALNRSLREGTGIREAAREFRGSLGLTSQQESWVASYRRALENQSRQALQRELRDRRYDGRVEAAIERARPLTDKQVDAMVERYRKNALAMRSETIARTEAGRATSQARDEATEQMIELTGIERERIEETWHATRDKRVRDWHASMNGQKVARGTPFIDGLGQRLRYPHDPQAPANTTIQCRRTTTVSIRPAS